MTLHEGWGYLGARPSAGIASVGFLCHLVWCSVAITVYLLWLDIVLTKETIHYATCCVQLNTLGNVFQ